MQLGHALVVKGDLAADENVEDDTEAPDVDFWSGILTSLEQLWSSKVETAAEGLELALGGEQIAEAKVNDFDITGLADKDILYFEISVDDVVPVTVV